MNKRQAEKIMKHTRKKHYDRYIYSQVAKAFLIIHKEPLLKFENEDNRR